jgi:hypothetical protein
LLPLALDAKLLQLLHVLVGWPMLIPLVFSSFQGDWFVTSRLSASRCNGPSLGRQKERYDAYFWRLRSHNLLLYCWSTYIVHFAGLLDVLNILSADTGIFRQTESHSFGDHLISGSDSVNAIECDRKFYCVLCSLLCLYDTCESMFNQPVSWTPVTILGHTVRYLVEALYYKPEGRRFESRMRCIFQFT